jgi:nicotinamidase-related amidase
MVHGPRIPRAKSAIIINDMINSNLRSSAERSKIIDDSGLIANTARCVAELRKLGVPIFWVTVEKRADRADAVDNLTDRFIEGGMRTGTPSVAGSFAAANFDECPIEEGDYRIVKPRIDPFIGTSLDLLLRARGITTILMAGYSTNGGVESGARTGRDYGYNVVVLSDCCYNVEEDIHEIALKRIMPRMARVMTAAEAIDLME